ncbi:NAD binding site:D-amino acid oxidase [Prochlorococcus marinus str. MIT 9515]|uniref:NAD binding site:D-amino acid oxidase n=1 Tax=Prochlorococcus marinus (strain MIT 9515) TaxID=167542 RepID=A2BZ90_PROM5|nr:FAD-dependent oxidoreductase [Prochlorococcus marinus]ABM73101.1 NAD binding site:D-amino acid oxidase [Prochlorococcus marinus str. MIT 9515]
MKVLKKHFKKSHILIIGSGIIGKFNALELSEQGFQITIVDPKKGTNSSSAALGLLMSHMYQKSKGRSWELRKKSNELWPKWIKFLRQYDENLKIEKPLIQLTTDKTKFEKLNQFISHHPNRNLKVLDRDSTIIKSINKIFNIENLRGIISFQDGRIDPISLLKTLDIYIKSKKIKTIEEEIIKIKKINNQWISECKNTLEIKSDAIILCNSLEAIKLIDSDLHKIRLKPVLGQAIEIATNDKEIDLFSLPKHFSINSKNFIRINKNKLIIGSTDENKITPRDNAFEELTNFLENKPSWLNQNTITNKWFGIRSRPEGEPSPILRSLEKGLVLCTGFYKNGILLAPACSSWISDEIKKHVI